MKPLIAPHLAELRPYTPGRSIEEVERELGVLDVIKLASNESPFGPSPRAVEAMAKALNESHRYPDDAPALRAALAAKHSVPPELIVIGAGATDLIELCVRTFTSPGQHSVVSSCSFLAYKVFLRAAAVNITFAPVRDYAIDLDAIAAAVREDTRLIFIPNPNNPTGSVFGADALDRFISRIPPDVVLVLDDAYVDYHDSPDRPEDLAVMRRRERTVVLHSFSKVHGLAGMRVGYAMSNPALVDALRRVQRPFPVSCAAIAGALAALDDREYVTRVVDQNRRGRLWLAAALRDLGLAPLPTQTNFVTIPLAGEAEAVQITAAMLQRGVIIRHLDAFEMPSAVRISVGTDEDNQRAISALAEVLKERGMRKASGIAAGA